MSKSSGCFYGINKVTTSSLNPFAGVTEWMDVRLNALVKVAKTSEGSDEQLMLGDVGLKGEQLNDWELGPDGPITS